MSRKLTIAALLLLSIQLTSLNATAQISQAQKDTLAQVSRIELINGDASFLIVELLKDGLIREMERYNVGYDSKKKVTLNNKEIPEPFQSRYKQMLLDGEFIRQDTESSGSLGCDGYTVSALTKKINSKSGHNPPFRQNIYRLVRLMVEDKIADDSNNITVTISAENVAVNGRVLVTPVEMTYALLLRELYGFTPKNGEVFSIEIKHSNR
jgi:hypothetical protein